DTSGSRSNDVDRRVVALPDGHQPITGEGDRLALLLEDRSDLTIEIDVLRDRLQREGVRLDRN
ncbi:MAG: hypothetical protein VYA97_09115, partial [Pseudomonadota bacterium]|nr:hypothetical protein [Pseudomonadota bacterium]